MKRKKATSFLAMLLTLLMVFSLVASVLPSTAHAVSQDDIDALQQKKDEISEMVRDARSRIEALKEEKANVLEQKAALDAQNAFANEQLQLIAQEISAYDEIIAEKADEVSSAVQREEKQRALYKARVRAMEESGGYNILALILNSTSFNEFLTALDDMGCIMENDKAVEKKYMEAREETEAVKADYEAERAEYEGKQDELRKEQQELEAAIEDSFRLLDELDDEIEKAKKEQEAAEIQMEAAGASIQYMISQLMEQKRQEAAQNAPPAPAPAPVPQGGGDGGESSGSDASGSDAGWDDGGGSDSGWDDGSSGGYIPEGGSTGTFIWPVPCSTRVTSRYGPRIHPITGEVGRMHNGIDIDGFGNEGGAIVAADSGTVTVASFDRGYGNYIIIDHGSSQTLYAHMSGFAVSQGDYVSQGQTIGYLGSTGMATGTHCHYEIFINGQRVDPASFYSGLTFWNC